MTPQLERLGAPGIVGVGLILFCLSFYFTSIAPAREQLAVRKIEEAKHLAVASAPAAGKTEAASAGSAAPPLPSITETTERLKAITALAAKHGLALEQASYTVVEQNGQRRLDVRLPLKGAYPSLRAYLRELQALSADASLDELSLQRQQASDPLIDANVRISFRLALAS